MDKKIVVLGNTGKDISKAFSWFVKTVYDGFTRLGYDVEGFDYKSHTIPQIRKYLFRTKPYILFTHLTMHGFHDKHKMMELFSELRGKTDTIIVHTLNDARHEPRYKGDISTAFDIALVGQTEDIKDMAKGWKVPTYHWPYSSLTYDKMAPVAEDLMFKKPVFTGSPGSHKDRSQFIKKLQEIMPIKIVTTKSPENLRGRTPELSASAKCILGLCTGYDIGGYIDVRPFQYLGTGACMIMRKFKWMDEVIPPELYYSFDSYKDPYIVKEYFEQIKKIDTKPLQLEAFNYMQRYHSAKERMRNTIKVIEGEQDSVI